MERRSFLQNMVFCIPICVWGFFVFNVESARASIDEVRINEIQIAGGPGKTNDDFIELYNAGSEAVLLDGWKLRKQTSTGTESSIRILPVGTTIDPGEYFLWATTSGGFNGEVSADVSSSATISEGNTVILKRSDDSMVDSVVCKEPEGKNAIAYSEDDKVWKWVVVGTPGSKNIFDPITPIVGLETLQLTELFPDPKEASDSEGEFVEIYNYGTEEISLDGWNLSDGSSEKSLSGILQSKEYKAFYKTVSLNNSGDKISLESPGKKVIDLVQYEEAKEGWSHALNGRDWQWTPIVTPNKENNFPKGSSAVSGVRLNEILANSKGSEDGEFIELYNLGDEEVDISWWSIRDTSGSSYVFPGGIFVGSREYLVITKKQSGLSLNNSDERIELLDAVGGIVDVVSYKTSKEDVSWAFDGSKWRASLVFTPGSENALNSEPDVKKSSVPKEVYKDVYAYFSAKAKDGNGDKIKYRWDFGDGHKSYTQETKHKYTKKGKYTVTLRIDDGRESIEKTYSLEVKSYPKRKLRIVAIEPNPEGSDVQGEWVQIKNFDKKTVDLSGWSIATGKDKKHLTNHPISESVKVKKGKEVMVTRDVSKITLNNDKGVIELRSPDGKMIQRINYKKEGGAKEGEVYSKEEGKSWEWKQTEIQEMKEEALNTAIFLENKEEKINLEPMPKEVIGQLSRAEVSKFTEEVFQNTKITPRVLGVHSVRLRVEGGRYSFTTVQFSEHSTVTFWRSLKSKIRKLF